MINMVWVLVTSISGMVHPGGKTPCRLLFLLTSKAAAFCTSDSEIKLCPSNRSPLRAIKSSPGTMVLESVEIPFTQLLGSPCINCPATASVICFTVSSIIEVVPLSREEVR